MVTLGQGSIQTVVVTNGRKNSRMGFDEGAGAVDYENTPLYKLAKQMAVEIHQMTLKELPPFEAEEEGPQIRRSSKLVVAYFVEAYSRRQYRAEYHQLLTQALAACNTTKAHLEMLRETGSLVDGRFIYLHRHYGQLADMLRQLSTAHDPKAIS